MMTCQGHRDGGRQSSAWHPFRPTPISSLAIPAAELRLGRRTHDAHFSSQRDLTPRSHFPRESAKQQGSSPRAPVHGASLPSSFKIHGLNANTESNPQVFSSKAQDPAGRSKARPGCRAAGTKRVSVRARDRERLHQLRAPRGRYLATARGRRAGPAAEGCVTAPSPRRRFHCTIRPRTPSPPQAWLGVRRRPRMAQPGKAPWPPELQERHRVPTNTHPGPGLTLHRQEDAPQQHGCGGLERGASCQPAGAGFSRWKGA